MIIELLGWNCKGSLAPKTILRAKSVTEKKIKNSKKEDQKIYSLAAGLIISDQSKYNLLFTFFSRRTEKIDRASKGNLARRVKSLLSCKVRDLSCSCRSPTSPYSCFLNPDPSLLQGTSQPEINKRKRRQRHHNLGKWILLNNSGNWLLFTAEQWTMSWMCHWESCFGNKTTPSTLVASPFRAFRYWPDFVILFLWNAPHCLHRCSWTPPLELCCESEIYHFSILIKSQQSSSAPSHHMRFPACNTPLPSPRRSHTLLL